MYYNMAKDNPDRRVEYLNKSVELGDLHGMSGLAKYYLERYYHKKDYMRKAEQLLLTAPVSLASAVLGKYFAAAAVLLLTILCSNLYTLIIAFYGTVYAGEWFVGYLGFTLQSLSFLALDLLVSCFAKNQITGAVAGFGANFFLWMTDLLASNVGVSWLRDALNFISLYDRYEPFLLGQLSYASVLFFVSFIIVCLAGAVRVLDARRFGEGGAA